MNTRLLYRFGVMLALLVAAALSGALAPAAYAQEGEPAGEEGEAEEVAGKTATNECQAALAPRLRVGEQGVVGARGLNMRNLPEGSAIGLASAGDRFDVVDGPRFVLDKDNDCLTWWYIYLHQDGFYGWVAEGWGDYWVSPVAAAALGAPNPIPDDNGQADVGGELIQTLMGDLTEWAVWRGDRGYIVLGWTWITEEGALGCAVPESGPLSAARLCALVQERLN